MALNLPSLDAAIRQPRPNAKPEPRKRTKGRKLRAEGKVKTSVRAACVARDFECRLGAGTSADWPQGADRFIPLSLFFDLPCAGLSEWAHMHAKRRSQTRGQAPERRHDTAHSLMLCKFHHQEYDAHRLRITALTRKGADGPLKFRRAK